MLAAVLHLSNNKTYGQAQREASSDKQSDNTKTDKPNKKGKLLYKCVPNDKEITPLLVPYEMKHMGFSKVFQNLYVLVEKIDDKHAVLKHVIGPVDKLENFYEYQLYCRNLNKPIKELQQQASKKINEFQEKINSLNLPIHNNAFSIDPEGCTDFDDAFAIQKVNESQTKITIYIANVPLVLNALNLWPSLSERTATIYLPNKRVPMLPACLSEGLCSLKAGCPKPAFYMEFLSEANSETNEISNITFGNCLVQINKNYVYEEPSLLKNPDYQRLKNICAILFPNKIADSHDVVSEMMILMNMESAKYMIKHSEKRSEINKNKTNIVYRATKKLQRSIERSEELPQEMRQYIYDYAGEYTLTKVRHETMDKEFYIHITSPIRRLVDTLNMMTFQLLLDPELEPNQFYEQWFQKMDYINETSKAIKKTQQECELLDLCTNNPSILEKEYDGIIVGDLVFLKELKLFSRFSANPNATSRKFKLFLFHDEEFFRKKIRVALIE